MWYADDNAMKTNKESFAEALCNDRMLFSSLLRHVVQAPSN